VNTHYTDVDRMILSRWNEVAALQDAYDNLLDRMEKTISSATDRVGLWLAEQGYQCEADARQPYINAWKKEWEKPKGQPLVHFQVADFAPIGYGKADTPHPFLWLFIDGLERIRLKEDDCRRFSKELKVVLGAMATKWDHQEADDTTEPLGRYCVEISPQDRLDLVAQPAKLVAFVETGFSELFELVPAVEQTLAKCREGKKEAPGA
jgi:hypothetical protein